jgi:ABC-type phosphate/phosphonate transport system substrate-binding protein/rhodanese-related sulfurtransferase
MEMHRVLVLGRLLALGCLAWATPAGSADSQATPARQAPAAANGRPTLIMSVTQEASEEIRMSDILESYTPFARYLSQATGTEVKAAFSRNMTAELQRTRTGSADILLGPAHMIGSALRYGYEPVATFSASQKMVFLVPQASTIKSLDDAKGRNLGLPNADSLAAYLALGEFNSKGLQIKSYFNQIRNYNSHEIGLHALGMGVIDMVVAEQRIAKEWLSANKGQIIYETRSVPGSGLALNTALDKNVRQRIHDALLSPNSKRASAAKLAGFDSSEIKPVTEEEYRYVSTLGYFTPTVLAGAKIVTAEEVQQLLAKGATFYDVRSEKEYKEKHCKGALLLPYHEKSKKEVGYDMSQDDFKLTEVAKDKNAPLIFACNGGECWKSYKASLWAQKLGYQQVHWFRGGFPEWKAKNLPME